MDGVNHHLNLVGRHDLIGQIYRQLRQAILDGQLRAGDRLPSTRDLAVSLGVSRTTVSASYDRLMAQSFVTARVGAGTFVSDQVAPVLAQRHRRGMAPSALRPRSVWDSLACESTLDPVEYDFRTGLPDASLFPFKTWRRLVDGQWRTRAVGTGGIAHPGGHPGLRDAVARHLAITSTVEAWRDDITITHGAQQGLDLAARVMLSPGDRVAVEDPGYSAARRLFLSHGTKVQGVPVDQEGLVVDAILPGTRLVYVTPSHQYPLGVRMSPARRHALLDWAQRNNAAVIEDDYDTEFTFHGTPIEPLCTLDTAGRVIYVGTFSKTMLPTFRLGFVLTPPPLTHALQTAKYVSDGHTSLPLQAAMADFMEQGGYARHVRRVRSVYRERHEMVTDLLRRDFADQFEVVPSLAGIHVTAVARAASPQAIHAAAERALANGVGVEELAPLSHDSDALAGFALGYGCVGTAHIPEGLRRLRECIVGAS